MEIMNIQTMAIAVPTHALGSDVPSRLRAFEGVRPGYTPVAIRKHTWLDGDRLAPDSVPGIPPA